MSKYENNANLKISDLLDTNDGIVYIHLWLRGTDGKRIKEIMIGVEPDMPKQIYKDDLEIVTVVNRMEKNKDDRGVILKNIPKTILNLNVYEWNTFRSYGRSRGLTDSEGIMITSICGSVPEISEAKKQIDGQMSIDMAGNITEDK